MVSSIVPPIERRPFVDIANVIVLLRIIQPLQLLALLLFSVYPSKKPQQRGQGIIYM
jgi:hypothetical protein